MQTAVDRVLNAGICQRSAVHLLDHKAKAHSVSQAGQKPSAHTSRTIIDLHHTGAAVGSCRVCSSRTRLVTTRPTADYLLDVPPAMGSTRSDRAQIRWGFNPALECTRNFSTQPFTGAPSTRGQQQSSNTTPWLRTGPRHRNGRIHPHMGPGSTPKQGFIHNYNTRAQ